MSLNIIVIHKPIRDAIHVTLSIFIYSLYSYFLTHTYLKNGAFRDRLCLSLNYEINLPGYHIVDK